MVRAARGLCARGIPKKNACASWPPIFGW
ncbi:hypothetical protein [Pseudomonas sp.]